MTCTTCSSVQYAGQTTQKLRKIHYGHRSDIRSGVSGLGSHFRNVHGVGLDLQEEVNLKTCMASFQLVAVGSVRQPSSQEEVKTSQAYDDRLCRG